MSKVTINIAKKIQQLIQGDTIPLGQLKSPVIDSMISEGVLSIKLQGRSKKTVFAPKPQAIENYLSSHLGINNVEVYISNLKNGTSRTENIIASTNSKSSLVRTFKGFLVNCVYPIEAKINGNRLIIAPPEGTYTYIHDFEGFTIPPETLIIGVENPENFRFVRKQTHLFDKNSILFVSRYPQSKDLISWLQNIPNKYLHYGDFDFEGIRIFRDEYYKHLGNRASFFIPKDIERLISKYGNKNLYDKQYKSISTFNINDEIEQLIALFHKYKRCLEQEILITQFI